MKKQLFITRNYTPHKERNGMHNYISFLYDTKTKELKLTEKCQDMDNQYYYQYTLGTASLVSSTPLMPSGIVTPYTTTPIPDDDSSSSSDDSGSSSGEGGNEGNGGSTEPSGDNTGEGGTTPTTDPENPETNNP